MPPLQTKADRVAAVREFNRFYTGVIGVLREGLLDTPYTLTEARIIFELAQRDTTGVGDLRRALDLDAGYASRILARFEADGLVTRVRSHTDARRQVVRLTARGRAAYRLLDERAADEVGRLLAPLPDGEQRRLVAALRTTRDLLGGPRRPGTVAIREPGPGDLGWVVQRHGALYAEEYGWDGTFEVLVARIVADYAEHRDASREAGWIAVADGEPGGCVFCMRKDDSVAQLRLLLVEPWARGLGIGGRLVDECVRFARAAGYRELVLWTNDVLREAGRLYRRAGFELVEEEPHESFGATLTGQIWRLGL